MTRNKCKGISSQEEIEANMVDVASGAEENSTTSILENISVSCSNFLAIKQIVSKLTNMKKEIEELKRDRRNMQRKLDETHSSANTMASSLTEAIMDIVKQIKEERNDLINQMEEDRIEILEHIAMKKSGNAMKTKIKKHCVSVRSENQSIPPATFETKDKDMSLDSLQPDTTNFNNVHNTPIEPIVDNMPLQSSTLKPKDEDKDTPLQKVTLDANRDDTFQTPTGFVSVIESIPVLYNSNLIPVCDTVPENKTAIRKDLFVNGPNLCSLSTDSDASPILDRNAIHDPESSPAHSPYQSPAHSPSQEINCSSPDQSPLRIDEVDEVMNCKTFVADGIDPPTRLGCSDSSQCSLPITPAADSKVGVMKNTSYKKHPKRFCLYCNKHFYALSKHLMSRHKNETLVSQAMKDGPGEQRNKGMRKLLILGINKENGERIKKGQPVICIRKQKEESNKAQCNRCKGIFNRSCLWVHRKRCVGKNIKINGPDCTPLETVKRTFSQKSLSYNFHSQFHAKIIDKLSFDKVGKQIRNSEILQIIANADFEKQVGKKYDRLVRRRVSSHVRRVAVIAIEVNKLLIKEQLNPIEIVEMFNAEKLHYVKSAIQRICQDWNQAELKPVARGYDSSIKRASIALMSYFKEREDSKMVAQVEKFYFHLRSSSVKVTSYAAKISSAQKCNLRMSNMPSDADAGDIASLKSYIVNEFNELANDCTIWNMTEYIRLRRALVTRLTFFNGLRQIEVSELTIDEWNQAKENAYITEDQINNLSDEEKCLLDLFRLAYSRSKIYKKEIAVIIPKSCWKALDILADPEIRIKCKVNPNNAYVMPACRRTSEDPPSCYNDIVTTCRRANLPVSLCGDKLRHQVSMEFGHLEVEEKVKNLFYRFIGHSSHVSESTYQMPKALRTVTEIAPILKEIDESNKSKENETENSSLEEQTPCAPPQ